MTRPSACAILTMGLAAALTGPARGQFGVPGVPAPPAIPGIPGAAGAVPGAVPAVPTVPAVPAAAAAPRNLWSFLGITPEHCQACRERLCASQLGLLLNNATRPLGAFTGGIVPPLCPTVPTPAELAAAAAQGGPVGVAAKVKADEAAAKAKIAALEYLATVDCHYWPDAIPAFIQALRTERNECVRYAAARALGTGCCCNKEIIDALTLVVNGSDDDGNPSETSERVKAAAFFALSHCLARYTPPSPTPPEPPVVPPAPRPENPPAARPVGFASALTSGAPEPASATSYRDRLAQKPMALVLADARLALARSADAPLGHYTMPTGSRSLVQAAIKAANASPAPSSRSQAAAEARPEPIPLSRPAADLPPAPPIPPPPALLRDAEIVPAAAVRPSPPDGSLRTGQRGLFQILAASRKPRADS